MYFNSQGFTTFFRSISYSAADLSDISEMFSVCDSFAVIFSVSIFFPQLFNESAHYTEQSYL